MSDSSNFPIVFQGKLSLSKCQLGRWDWIREIYRSGRKVYLEVEVASTS
jgi:hypothetical protein